MTTRHPIRLSLHRLEDRDVPSVFTPTAKDRVLLVGSDAGPVARIWTFATDGTTDAVVYFDGGTPTPVYESTFTGGVRVATAEQVDPLGGPLQVFAPGPGRPVEVKILYPATGPHLSQQAHTVTFAAFEPTFTGGAFVTTGDFSGTGHTDVVVTPDLGGGPRVRIVRDGDPNTVVADFLGIDDANFRGGARTAVGDVNNDGVPDLVVAAGFGGGPRIAVFDGTTLRPGVVPRKLFNDFFVFEQTLRNGVYVAAADVNGDGFADVIAGGGPGGSPRVYGLSGQGLTAGVATPVANFFAGDPADRSGVRLAVKDIDGDARADLVTGAGSNVNTVTAYAGASIPADGTPTATKRFVVHEPFTDRDLGFRGGVFLG